MATSGAVTVWWLGVQQAGVGRMLRSQIPGTLGIMLRVWALSLSSELQAWLCCDQICGLEDFSYCFVEIGWSGSGG